MDGHVAGRGVFGDKVVDPELNDFSKLRWFRQDGGRGKSLASVTGSQENANRLEDIQLFWWQGFRNLSTSSPRCGRKKGEVSLLPN